MNLNADSRILSRIRLERPGRELSIPRFFLLYSYRGLVTVKQVLSSWRVSRLVLLSLLVGLSSWVSFGTGCAPFLSPLWRDVFREL